MNRWNRQKTLTLLIVIFSAFILYLLYAYSFIEITVKDSPTEAEIVYSLSRPDTSERTIRTPNKRIKKLVRRSGYEVLVESSGKSYFTHVEAKGFLKTVVVEATLHNQKGRGFVGDNPGPCMHYDERVLLSFSCTGSLNHAQVHIPATANRPTFTQTIASPLEGSIEGLVSAQEGTVAIVKAPNIGEEQGPPHGAYLIDGHYSATDGVPLSDLDEELLYEVMPYKEGFVAFSSSSGEVLYYPARKAKPMVLLLEPTDKSLKAYAASTGNEAVVVAYSNNTEGEVADIHDTSSPEVKTEIIVYKDGSPKKISFRGQYSQPTYCGDQRLCLLNGNLLEVYDITSEQPRLTFVLNNISSTENTSTGFLAVNDKGILVIDVNKKVGYLQYAFGGYSFCGISAQSNRPGYTLCLINPRQEKIALYIDSREDDAGSIDKKILKLLEIPEVNTISAYGNYVFISPDLGDLEYDSGTNSYGYNPDKKRDINNKIQRAIEGLAAPNRYTFINTLQ